MVAHLTSITEDGLLYFKTWFLNHILLLKMLNYVVTAERNLQVTRTRHSHYFNRVKTVLYHDKNGELFDEMVF